MLKRKTDERGEEKEHKGVVERENKNTTKKKIQKDGLDDDRLITRSYPQLVLTAVDGGPDGGVWSGRAGRFRSKSFLWINTRQALVCKPNAI